MNEHSEAEMKAKQAEVNEHLKRSKRRAPELFRKDRQMQMLKENEEYLKRIMEELEEQEG